MMSRRCRARRLLQRQCRHRLCHGLMGEGADTASGASAALASAALSLLFKLIWPDLPFMDRVGLVFLLCLLIGVGWSLLRPLPQSGFVRLDKAGFSTTQSFNLSAVTVTLILVFFYAVWW